MVEKKIQADGKLLEIRDVLFGRRAVEMDFGAGPASGQKRFFEVGDRYDAGENSFFSRT